MLGRQAVFSSSGTLSETGTVVKCVGFGSSMGSVGLSRKYETW